jgi:hypothetical protein
MERWYEKSHQAMQRIDYISAVQQGRDDEEHGFQVLRESHIDCIKKSTEYWVKMAQEPHQEIRDKWTECEKSWNKINQAMIDIDVPEFDTHDEFFNLHDIVKLHVKQYSSWDS